MVHFIGLAWTDACWMCAVHSTHPSQQQLGRVTSSCGGQSLWSGAWLWRTQALQIIPVGFAQTAAVEGVLPAKPFCSRCFILCLQIHPHILLSNSRIAQKVNFLRDLKNDSELLERSYFPDVDLKNLSPQNKKEIVAEIQEDFDAAFEGIKQLPASSKFGVYTAYRYYRQLLKKLQETPSNQIMESRIRVNDYHKLGLMVQSYFNIKLNF